MDPQLIVLEKFLNENNNLPAQGTVEWLKLRQGDANTVIFGGSEIPALLNEDHYKSSFELAKKKTFPEIYDVYKQSNPATLGNILEDVSRTIFEYYLMFDDRNDIPPHMKKIHECGSIQSEDSPYHRYSMDGIGAVRYDLLIRYFKNTNQYEKYKYILESDDIKKSIKKNNNYIIILFEIKNPYTRLNNGQIPLQYVGQIKAGLSTIKISQMGLFGDFTVRFCSEKDFNFNENFSYYFYNRSPKDQFKDMFPKFIGMIGLYTLQSKSEIKRYYEDKDSGDSLTSNIFDVGSLERNQFDKVMSLYTRNTLEQLRQVDDIKKYKCFYSEEFPFITLDEIQARTKNESEKFTEQDLQEHINEYRRCFLNEFYDYCVNPNNKFKPYAIICYKVFDFDIIPVQKDPDFIKKINPQLKSLNDVIIKMRTLGPDIIPYAESGFIFDENTQTYIFDESKVQFDDNEPNKKNTNTNKNEDFLDMFIQ